ncbi:DUF6457 domain-containing protein [Enemella sp. A6]|uniref:DUF6457 domain-containing protein n=1 Tax=Enemella sp. A6 TaxID=3440152 RepID=UPI003EBCA294
MTEETKRVSEWIRELTAEIGLDDVELDEDSIHILLDLARDVAHQVIRPATPISTYLLGIAVGRGASLGAVAAKATALALGHNDDDHDDEDAEIY